MHTVFLKKCSIVIYIYIFSSISTSVLFSSDQLSFINSHIGFDFRITIDCSGHNCVFVKKTSKSKQISFRSIFGTSRCRTRICISMRFPWFICTSSIIWAIQLDQSLFDFSTRNDRDSVSSFFNNQWSFALYLPISNSSDNTRLYK